MKKEAINPKAIWFVEVPQMTDAVDAAAKKKRTRSPAYPYVNLEGAINRVKQFYEKEQRNAANINIAVTHWGFEKDSSSGSQTVAALISFGLMADEGSGDKRAVRLTQDALRIHLDNRPDSTERADLLKKCALAPKIHRQIWEKWGANLPSDANLRHHLLFDWEVPFNENSVDFFIGEYKSTIAYAKITDSDIVETEEGQGISDQEESPGEGAENEGVKNPKALLQKHGRLPLGVGMQEFVVPLSEGSKAIFQWPTTLSQEDILDLTDSLKILERKISRVAKTNEE